MSSVDLSSLYTRLRSLRHDPDPRAALRDLWNDLGVSKGKLRDFEAEFHSAGVEILEELGWIELGDDKCIGVETSKVTKFTDWAGSVEMVMDLVPDLSEGQRETLADVLMDVLPKSQGGPWLKTGLQKHGINVAPLYYTEPRTGSDGEPVRRLKTMDRKFMKQPKKAEEEAA